MDQFAKETIPISLEEEMRKSYLDYAMSVIVGRALPDARDGLKPVHRRVLFGMHELNNVWNRPYVKCARVVGEVMGKYHPHGDASIYDTLVRMAQDFSMRYMLVDGQGNFGSIDGDNAAAMRYTECRLDKISQELLADIDKETVDFAPNYDGKEKEPTVLPTRIPNLLINGSSGIAVGMATNIPPHNLTEVINGALHVLANPECSIDELIELIPAPDFPTGATIYGVSGVRDGYRTGRGRVVMRAKTHFEEYGKEGGRTAIIVDIGQGDCQAFQHVAAFARLAQLEHGTARHHFAAVRQEGGQHVLQVHQLWLAVHQGDHIHAEGVLQLGLLVQIVQHHLRHFAAFQLDHHAHARLVGLVADDRAETR